MSKFIVFFVLCLSLHAPVLQSAESDPEQKSSGRKTPGSSPRQSRQVFKTFEKSLDKIFPDNFHDLPRPEISSSLLFEILRSTLCIENTPCGRLFRISAHFGDDRYLYFSPDLREDKKILPSDEIVFIEKKRIGGTPEIKAFIYVVRSNSGNNKHLFWITHFVKNDAKDASREIGSPNTNYTKYITDILKAYGNRSDDNNKTHETQNSVHFEDEEDYGQTEVDTPRSISPGRSVFTQKPHSKIPVEVSKARAFMRKKRPSQTSDDDFAKGQTSPPSSPKSTPDQTESPHPSSSATSQSPHPPTKELLTREVAAFMVENGLRMKIAYNTDSASIWFEPCVKSGDTKDCDLIFGLPVQQHPHLNANLETLHQESHFKQNYASSSKSMPEVINLESPTRSRGIHKKRSNSVPPKHGVHTDKHVEQ